jgi:hypothetical protein
MLWFKRTDGLKPNLLLLSCLLLAYPLAWCGLSSPAWFAPALQGCPQRVLLSRQLVGA